MARLPRFEPMLASTGPIPADAAGIAVEPKFDGFRCIAYLNDSTGPPLRAYSRAGRPMGDSVPELAPLAAAVGVDAVLDGELIVTDDAGRPDFYALSRRMLTNTTAPLAHLRARSLVTFVVFDVLWLDGAALVANSYAERRARLEELALSGPCWTTAPSYEGIAPGEVLAVCADLGLEGIVVKGVSSIHEPRRSRAWVTMCRDRSRCRPRRRPETIRV